MSKQYSAAPAMSIDTSKNYSATIETSKGPITVGLFAKDAPKQAAPPPVAVAEGPDLGPLCDKAASVAARGARRAQRRPSAGLTPRFAPRSPGEPGGERYA
jgi:hypothetical protein